MATISLGKITQGELGTLTFTWSFPEYITSPASVSGATITATMTDEDGTTTTVSGTLTGTAATTVTWALSAGDSGTAGTFTVIFRAVVSGVTTYTLEATLEVIDNPSATAVQNSALVGISVADAAWLTAASARVADGDDVATRDTDGTAGNLTVLDADGDAVDAGYGSSAFDAAGAASAVAGDLTSHENNTSNPHGVTAAQVGAEPALGNPATNGYLLSSTSGGTRSWIAAASGGYGNNVVIVNAAGGGDYTTLSAALAAITTASAANRYLIIVVGLVAETAVVTAKAYVDVLFEPGAQVTVTISTANSYGVSFLNINNTTWAGMGNGPHIVRAGSGTGSQNGLRVQGNDSTLVLYGLVVRNDAIYTTVGAAIYCNQTSAKLIRVTGIGSTAGNDAYGIQLVQASPEMRECIGYGGSNGGSCHGILTGTISNATMIRCIGYGGNGGISSRGINNAYGSNITMIECIGVGGDYTGGSGLFVNNTTSLRAIRCIGIGGGVIPKNGTAAIAATSRQDDSFRAHATLPYRITGLAISVTAAAGAGVTLTFRTATGGGGNAITAAVSVSVTGSQYIPISGNYVISGTAYVYGRLSAVDATLAYTVYYTYELCSNASYGIYHDSDAQVNYEDCTAMSNADSEAIYVGGNNGLTKFLGGTARSGRNDGTRRKAMTCLASWSPGQVYDMVLDGGSTNLVAAAGTANGSNIEI